MIRLYQFPRRFGIPNASPFCMKVECALRMAGLEYEPVVCANPGKGPKGKVPFIEDGGMRLGDSELILDYLRERYDFDPDAGLGGEQRAISRAFQALLDDRFYWANLHNRWCDPQNWPTLREAFFGELPFPLRSFVPEMVRRGLRKELHGHGLGRHAPEEIYAFAIADLRAVAVYLADKPYFHGERPTRIDAGLMAYLTNLFRTPFTGPIREEGDRHPNLRAYAHRMLSAHFPEFGPSGD